MVATSKISRGVDAAAVNPVSVTSVGWDVTVAVALPEAVFPRPSSAVQVAEFTVVWVRYTVCVKK